MNMGRLIITWAVLMCTLLGVLLVYGVYEMDAKKRCLESGYPKAEVAWDLSQYCLNLDGAVTGQVDKLDD